MRSPRGLACPVVVIALLTWGASAAAQTPATPDLANPAGPVSLRDAVSLALTQSPELLAFDAGRRASEARLLQAARLPNPVLDAMVEDVGGTSRGPDAANFLQPQTTVQLSQLVELGGKRAARQRLAGLDRDLANWDYEAARLDVLTRVSAAFLEVLAAQQAVTQGAQALEVAGRVRQTVGERVAAGVVAPIEETRAGVLLASAQLRADQAARALEARRRQLATFWGSTTPMFAAATGDLEALPSIPPVAALHAALADNPELARFVAEVDRRQASLALARSARVPDMTLSAGYRRFTSIDTQAFVIGASIPLPWFDRNRDGIRAAEASIDEARHAARAAELTMVARLADAYRALASANDDVTTLRRDVIPGARAVFETVQEGYELGRFGLLDVLDAQRTLVEAEAQHLEALTMYHQAVVAVERLVGQPLTDFAAEARQ